MSSVQHVFLKNISASQATHTKNQWKCAQATWVQLFDLSHTALVFWLVHAYLYIYKYKEYMIWYYIDIFFWWLCINAVVSCLGRKVEGFIGSSISTCLSKKHQGQLRRSSQNKCQNWDMALAQYLAWPLRQMACATLFIRWTTSQISP